MCRPYGAPLIFETLPTLFGFACARLQGGLNSCAPAALGPRAAIFIFSDWHYHSSFPIGIIIHLSRLALSFIFPDWHYHSSFPIGIIIHLSRLALSFIFPDWHYHFIFLNRHHYCSGKLDWRGAKSSDYTVIGER